MNLIILSQKSSQIKIDTLTQPILGCPHKRYANEHPTLFWHVFDFAWAVCHISVEIDIHSILWYISIKIKNQLHCQF